MSVHINAKKEDIASRVIMSGDPFRVKYIAEKYLSDYKVINTVRGMLGYTGYYKNERITVMSHGMGIPSAGIYTYELYNEFNVESIIRLGTAGSYDEDYNINDIVLVISSYSNSVYALNLDGYKESIIDSSKEINEKIEEISNKKGILLKKARVHSTDNFYTKNNITDYMRDEKKCSLVEMESFALFNNARFFNKKASCILTVSDSFITKEELSSEERESKLNKMIELGLDSLISL